MPSRRGEDETKALAAQADLHEAQAYPSTLEADEGAAMDNPDQDAIRASGPEASPGPLDKQAPDSQCRPDAAVDTALEQVTKLIQGVASPPVTPPAGCPATQGPPTWPWST